MEYRILTDQPSDPGTLPILDRQMLELHAEQALVSKRRSLDQVVRVAIETRLRDTLIDEPLRHEQVAVEHVAIGRYVDAVPEVRQEGNTTILPIVEEEVVVTKRLFLREEVHVRKVSTTTNHLETVHLREQHAVVTRLPRERTVASKLPHAEADVASPQNTRSLPMPDETIVAVYDTTAHADAAVADLRAAQVPESAISRHASQTETSAVAAPAPVREQGFWSSLFGGEDEHDAAVYDRSLDAGSSVVVVKGTPGHDVEAVMAILERHSPIDIDERGAGYGLSSTTRTSASTA